jgi:hypothetical protein
MLGHILGDFFTNSSGHPVSESFSVLAGKSDKFKRIPKVEIRTRRDFNFHKDLAPSTHLFKKAPGKIGFQSIAVCFVCQSILRMQKIDTWKVHKKKTFCKTAH